MAENANLLKLFIENFCGRFLGSRRELLVREKYPPLGAPMENGTNFEISKMFMGQENHVYLN